MQINPFKGAVLLNQILNVLEFFLIQTRICDNQNTPVDGSGFLKDPFDILLCGVGKTAHCHIAHNHFTFFQYKDWVQKQRVAEDLHTF